MEGNYTIKNVANEMLLRWKLFRTTFIRKDLGNRVRRLDIENHVLISNNCISGQLYEMAGIQKRSPTAGLFFRNGAYARFLHSLANREWQPWASVSRSELTFDQERRCPVWDLGDGDEVVFLHYRDSESAARKWTERFERMMHRRPIIIATMRDGIDPNEIAALKERFEYFVMMQPCSSSIDNDGVDIRYLSELSGFLGRVSCLA